MLIEWLNVLGLFIAATLASFFCWRVQQDGLMDWYDYFVFAGFWFIAFVVWLNLVLAIIRAVF